MTIKQDIHNRISFFDFFQVPVNTFGQEIINEYKKNVKNVVHHKSQLAVGYIIYFLSVVYQCIYFTSKTFQNLKYLVYRII